MTEKKMPQPELEVEHAHYQRLLEVQKKVARALNNLPTSDVLYVLADLVKSILDAQEDPRRKKNCDAFVKMISPSPSVIVMTDEYGRKKQ